MKLSQAIPKAAEHLGELEGSEVVEQHVGVNSIAKAATVVHGWNDPKQSETNNTVINLQLLATRPEELAMKQARDVQAVVGADESPKELGEAEQSRKSKAGKNRDERQRFLEAGEQPEAIKWISINRLRENWQ